MQFSLRRKTAVGLGLGALAGVVLGATAVQAVYTLGNSLETTAAKGARTAESLARVRSGLQVMTNEARSAQLLFAVRKLQGPEHSGACSACHDVAQAASVSDTLRQRATDVRDVLSLVSGDLGTPPAKAASHSVEQGLNDWLRTWDDFLQTARSDRYEDAHEILTSKLIPAMETVGKAADVLMVEYKASLHRAAAEAEVTQKHQLRMALAMAVLTVLINAAVLWLLLSAVRKLSRFSGSIAEATSSLAGTAGDLEGNGSELTDNAERQAAMLQQTGTAGDRISECAARNAQSSDEAAAMLRSVVQTTNEVRGSLANLTGTKDAALRTGEKVAGIAKAVEEIAMQTNLLALNASVEAARAGAAGAGFAVVADEVRTLAQRCSEAARETSLLMQASVHGANEGRSAIGMVQTGVERVTAAADSLGALMEKVRAGSAEQVAQVREVASAITDLSQVTERMMASAQSSRQKGRSLAAQSGELDGVAERLDELVRGR